MTFLTSLRPSAAILIGASVMLSLTMGTRQSLGLFVQPAVKDLAISVADFTLAVAAQNLIWGFLQPFAGALAAMFSAPIGQSLSQGFGWRVGLDPMLGAQARSPKPLACAGKP